MTAWAARLPWNPALHPMADLATEPRWARISGTFGEDAEMSTRLTAAYIHGFQGDSLTRESVACMTKHFPGGGPQKDGWDAHFKYGKEQVCPGDRFDYHLIPFKAAIQAGTAQMMPYYGIPVGQTNEDVGFAFNKEIISGLLQDQLNYEGIVCTDWGIISKISIFGLAVTKTMDHGVEHLSPEEKVKKALNAGIDQFGGEQEPKYIIELVKEGEVSEDRINKSLRKLLKLKFDLGLFDNPYVDEEEARKVCGSREFREAGKMARLKSMVLLTNKDYNGRKILPLKEGLKIFIKNVDSSEVAKYGDVVNHIEDADITLLQLNTPYELRKGFIENIFHQGSLAFPEDTLRNLLSVINTKPAIVSIYLDRPAVIPEIAESAAAVIGHFGNTDEAFMEMLFGLVGPSGKLPFELPSSLEAVEKQKEDVPYDSENPLFPYGYGLSYEELTRSSLSANQDQ